MCLLRNIALHDYQESLTTDRQTHVIFLLETSKTSFTAHLNTENLGMEGDYDMIAYKAKTQSTLIRLLLF